MSKMKFQMSNKKTSDHHITPPRVYKYLHLEFGIELRNMFDPCPENFSKDGLKIKWHASNFINPPYSLIEEFVKKAYSEFLNKNRCYILYPLSKTDKPYFHNYLESFPKIFFPFRIKFVGAKNPSPQTHCLVIMS